MRKFKRIALTLALLIAAVLAVSVAANATELKTGVGIVQASGLRLRAKPNTDADILDNANYGDYVVVIRESGDFYLVDYNLTVGYMAKDYITFKERENVELGYGSVNEACNLREKPNSSSSIVTQLSAGDKAFIIGINCGWYKVQYNGETGYIRSDLVTLTEKPYCNSNGSAIPVGQLIVNFAENYLGTAYVWGGTTPSGFDCSGFTQYVYAQNGYKINRTAAEQLSNGYSVTNLQPGDLVFFKNTYGYGLAASHVGIYIGDNQFIHAASGGVKITSLSDSYYASRYVGARRIAG